MGTVRTDLDKFSPLLVHCLCNHGYAVAHEALSRAGCAPPSGIKEVWNPLSPNVPTSADVAKDMRTLQQEAYSRWRLLSLREWKPLLLYLLTVAAIAILAYFYVPRWVAGGIDASSTWVHEFQRRSWREDSLNATVAFGDQRFLGAIEQSLDEEKKDRFRLDRWLRWINDGIRPKNRREQVLVVESPVFESYYRGFDLSICPRETSRLQKASLS